MRHILRFIVQQIDTIVIELNVNLKLKEAETPRNL